MSYHIYENSLHERAIEIAARFHKAEFELIEILQKIDQAKLFLNLGHTSLFAYATKALKLSEANACNFIAVARKSKIVPELKKAIQAGALSVATARKITPVINLENSGSWIEMAKTLPKLELEKQVAKVNPQSATPERAKYIQEERLEVRLGVSEKTMKSWRRAQDLVSQKIKNSASLEQTLEQLLEFYLEKHDPVKKAERILQKQDNARASVPDRQQKAGKPSREEAPEQLKDHTSSGMARNKRPNIPAVIRHHLHFRDQGRCTHINHKGERCASQRWLEIHHVNPLHNSGKHDVNNLKLLCSAHHKTTHEF